DPEPQNKFQKLPADLFIHHHSPKHKVIFDPFLQPNILVYENKYSSKSPSLKCSFILILLKRTVSSCISVYDYFTFKPQNSKVYPLNSNSTNYAISTIHSFS